MTSQRASSVRARSRNWALRLGALSGVALLAAVLTYVNNNYSVLHESRNAFETRLSRATESASRWVLSQTFVRGVDRTPGATEDGAAILTNPALLHMLVDCEQLSGDARLRTFQDIYFRSGPHPGFWGRMVDPKAAFEQPPEAYLNGLADYDLWMLHAIAPREYKLSAAQRVAMFAPGRFHTGHATHQVLSLYLFRKLNGATPELDSLINHVAERIASEAAVDFRVTDLYLQRVATLLAAGRADLVRGRWVERILAAQQRDGGWRYTWHGWSPSPLHFDWNEEASTSHPTVQGLWMCEMLKFRYPDWIRANFR